MCGKHPKHRVKTHSQPLGYIKVVAILYEVTYLKMIAPE